MAETSKIGRNMLLIGSVLGIGAAAVGYYVYNLPEPETLDVRMPQAKTTSDGLTGEAAQIESNVTTERRMVDEEPGLDKAFVPRDKAKDKKIPRYTPLFFAPTIWEVRDEAQKKNVAVDLLASDSRPLHTVTAEDGTTKKPVPNAWFYTHGLEQHMCDADAMQQDADGDGFTNGEEFLADTDPSDAAAMPSFDGGGTVKIESVGQPAVRHHRMELSTASSFADNTANIIIYDKSGTQRLRRHETLKPGAKFGIGDKETGPLGKERFTLKEIKTVKDDDSGMEFHVALIHDSYTRRNDDAEFDLKEGSRARRDVRDTLQKFRVTAGPMKGKPDAEITVQLGETFEIPGFPGVQCQFSSAGDKKTSAKVKVSGGKEKVDEGKEYPVPIDDSDSPKKSK